MNKLHIKLRLLLAGIMLTALFFGFLHLFAGGSLHNYERLHIFLFNLCAGGSILIFFTEDRERISAKNILFLLLSVVYALLAFFEIYIAAVVAALVLALITDSIRVRKFSLFPSAFFDSAAPVSAKFHQASLLCLSIGLAMSGMVIVNNEYLHLVSFSKLKLDTFFLGFSFPLSLITMSVMFSFMERGDRTSNHAALKNACFWTVNLGVIIFFVFILLELPALQLVVTTILTLAVATIFFLFKKHAKRVQQKAFLVSGILFLLYTAVTGIAYIIITYSPEYEPERMKYLLRMHSFASLYGWNLCGLAVICRRKDFPLRLHSGLVIAVHWLTAVVLAPLGSYYRPFSICALLSYGFILYMIMLSKGKEVEI